MNNEQLQLFTPLDDEEMKAVYLATGAGCLQAMNDMIPGPAHQKRKRCLTKAHDAMVNYGVPRLRKIADRSMPVFTAHIKACNQMLKDIASDGSTRFHVLLNLSSFCLELIPSQERHADNLTELFGLFREYGAWDTGKEEKHGSGVRIFARIDQKLGVLLAV